MKPSVLNILVSEEEDEGNVWSDSGSFSENVFTITTTEFLNECQKNKELKLVGEDYWKLQQSKELGSLPPRYLSVPRTWSQETFSAIKEQEAADELLSETFSVLVESRRPLGAAAIELISKASVSMAEHQNPWGRMTQRKPQ